MNLLEKIVAISKEAAFAKDLKVSFKEVNYDAWSEASVLKVLRPLMVKHRVWDIVRDIEHMYSDSKSVKIKVTLELYDLDDVDTSIRFCGVGTGWDLVDKDSGKAFTYAVKYAYLKLFHAISGLDSDNEASEQTEEEVRKDAVVILNKLWANNFFHMKAAKEQGVVYLAENKAAFETRARELYQERHSKTQEEKLSDVANMIQTMNTLLNGK
jgi:hypothetical protein